MTSDLLTGEGDGGVLSPCSEGRRLEQDRDVCSGAATYENRLADGRQCGTRGYSYSLYSFICLSPLPAITAISLARPE